MSTSVHNLQSAATAPISPPPLVLIAEDHEDTRSLLKTVMLMNGYAVSEAVDGEEAVRLAQHIEPDIILMDGGLPGVDGFAATRRIRGFSPSDHVPIVFLSGHAGPTFVDLAREAGCDEYMVKPIDLHLLADVLKKYLQKKARAFAR